jgi:PAS domain S-box-containing protein
MQTSVGIQAERNSPPARQLSRLSIRVLLYWLVLACLLPAALWTSFTVYFEYNRELALSEEDMFEKVRAKVEVVDARLAQSSIFAHAISTTNSLNRKDLAEFQRRASNLLHNPDVASRIVLFDKNGQQLVNTDFPWGQPLPKRLDLGSILSVFSSGHAESPTLIASASNGLPVIRTLAPVFVGQSVMYVLGLDLNPEIFVNTLQPHRTGSGTITTILDSMGTITARSQEHSQFVGQKVEPEIWAQIQKQPKGAFEFKLKNGILVRSYLLRSSKTGWHVLTMTPKESFEAHLIRQFALVIKGGVVILLFSLGLAWFVGRRIVKSVNSLKTVAVALGGGGALPPFGVTLRETDEVAQSLRTSALQLTNHTRELFEANQSLIQRTAELADAQHLAQIGNWTFDLNTQKRFASVEMHQLFGSDVLLPFAEQLGKLLPPETWEQLDRAIKNTIRTGLGYALVLEIFNKDGFRIWTDNRGEAVIDDRGEVIGLRGTCQDISKFKAVELELNENKTRLKMALASSDLALWDWNIQSGVLLFDERWAAMQGYMLNEVPFRIESYMQDVYPEDVVIIQKKLEAHYQGFTAKYEAYYRVRHKDGHTLWIQGIGRVVEWDAEGKSVRMLGVAYDITKRKHNEMSMKALQDELDATLVWQVAQHTVAALAHEVNQPLASASIMCTAANRMLVKEGLSGVVVTEKAKLFEQALTNIENDVVRAGVILKNLLKSLHKPNTTQVPSMVNELISESIAAALEEGIFGFPITTDFAADLPPVKVNPLQVRKVLLNLIHNGAQAMLEAQAVNGKIVVSSALAADGHDICITVQDDGPGISALIQQEIFQPFISTKSHGLGMGLTISRALIQAHGGKLWATQIHGQGATFHFTLPTEG